MSSQRCGTVRNSGGSTPSASAQKYFSRIARSLPGDIKEKGLAVLVEIDGGMFLTQLVETELPVPEGTTFREIRKYSCSSMVEHSEEGIGVRFPTGCANVG